MPVSLEPEAAARKQPFGQLLTQGTLYTAGTQLSNGAVVLPFICAHERIAWAAALLFPAYSIGSIVGNSASPAILQRVGRLRHLLLAASAATTATLYFLLAIIPWSGVHMGTVFLLTSAAGGVVVAVASVAYADMISNKLSASRRGELLLAQGAIGSVLATGVILLAVPVLARGDEVAYHRDLLWLGATGLAASAIAAVFVGPVRSVSVTTRMRLRDTYRQGFAVARSQPWFRRYAVTYLLFLPVSMGTTFYSLRTARQGGTLHVLVVLSSVGLVIGSALWRKVYRLHGVRGMLLGSALLSAAAAALSIVAEWCGQWFHTWAYGTVFSLATVSAQAVFAAAISWISVSAPEQHRGTLIGFGSTLVAIESAVLGAGFGAIAQIHTTSWPVVVMLVLAVVAGLAALGAPQSGRRAEVNRRQRSVKCSGRSRSKPSMALATL
ncbi:hypothetical protein [Mycobacterium lacus]|uniref:Uncharacterized protein n=1 Tax=Mycobacterium lacus TaxID=169765 RepID=A0A1X1XR90_9MYCO|nr:hypothetical protein [Mycobacterium lacus]MCV7122851.1 MFS transporter [Mycobacterium lacus]ORW01355.1 hypothetical protein AWC15_07395 [Mycobacterium lacus]BBX98005.1 hypothetical protein MLAC_32990 [Mycobacterium lacus]